MSKLAKALTAAAGNAAGDRLYVEDVFSTYLYTGADANETVTNGIDLAGEGGFVWIKPRTTTGSHLLFDTERGTGKYLQSHTTAAEATYNPYLSAFNSDGFTTFAFAPADYVSWTFRKAEKFFDVVTYTGTGTAQNIAHNLGVAPAVVIVKSTSNAQNWYVYHESLGNTQRLLLDSTVAAATSSSYWNNTSPTDSVFTVGTQANVNTSGATYVAYLFASDAGGFGDDESIIKCGSYTGTGSAQDIDLGFEPQWILIKRTNESASWIILDSMRGIVADGIDPDLHPNDSTYESQQGAVNFAQLNANGIKIDPANNGWGGVNENGSTYIYIAIRRPMKTPESGTEVFTPTFGTGSGFNFVAGFPVDMAIIKDKDNVVTSYASARLNSGTLLSTASTAAEFANAPAVFDSQVGYYESSLGSNYIGWLFKRATGFFDVVAYTGNYSINQINHNLNVVPELVILKARTASSAFDAWLTGALFESSSFTQLFLNTVDQAQSRSYGFFDYLYAKPTSDTITIGRSDIVNASGGKYIAYLFASVAGVSKVGSYTGTGSNIDVDCGFSAGARFILIKRTDSTGDWYVWDSARGIVAGNDPYLLLNSTAAEVTSTDYIDPLASGFTVTSSAPAALNASGGTYIFLAIA